MQDDKTTDPFEKRTSPFRGIAKKIQIISNNMGFGPTPMPDEEVEQRLTVTADGRVFFSSYFFGDGKSLVKSEARRLKIAPEIAAQILNEVGQFFAEDASIQATTDIGTWTMSLTNTAGEKFDYIGPMPCSDEALIHISSMIREQLDMAKLYVFDGAAFEDRIEKVTIDYRRVTTIKLDDPADPDMEDLKWVYSEKILLDRDTETLAYIQVFGPRCRVVRSYYVDPGVSEFLDDHKSTRLFSQIKGNPPDTIDDLSDFKDYIITVEYRDAEPLVVFGTFDKNGLPEDFSFWAKDIREFMAYYGMGEIIHPLVFGKARRRESDYIFCSVVFQDYGKSYYYLTDDDTLDVGDRVIVPVGSAGGTAIVEIEDIEYFSKEEVPFPLEKVKKIIRRYDKHSEDDSQASDLREDWRDEEDWQSCDEAHLGGKGEAEQEGGVETPQDSATPDSSVDRAISAKEHLVRPFDRIVLCDEKWPRVQIYVSAEVTDHGLRVFGHDFGIAPLEVFGKDEHEYWYDFDRENTDRLFALLSSENQDIAAAMIQAFSGEDGCQKLQDFCEANQIKYKFSTW